VSLRLDLHAALSGESAPGYTLEELSYDLELAGLFETGAPRRHLAPTSA